MNLEVYDHPYKLVRVYKIEISRSEFISLSHLRLKVWLLMSKIIFGQPTKGK